MHCFLERQAVARVKSLDFYLFVAFWLFSYMICEVHGFQILPCDNFCTNLV